MNNKVECLKEEDGYIIPEHYKATKYQAIEILRDTLDEKQYIGFCSGLIIKYITRANAKNRLRNYTKAKYYLDELINTLSFKYNVAEDRIKPAYYKNNQIETIDMIDDQLGRDNEVLIGFYAGVILKYVFRAMHKHGYEDFIKAKYYLDRALEFHVKEYKVKEES